MHKQAEPQAEHRKSRQPYLQHSLATRPGGPPLAFSSSTVKSSRPARGGSTRMVRSRSSSQGPSPSSRRRLPWARIVSANSSLAMRARNTFFTPLAVRLKRAASTEDLDTSVATTRRKFWARGTYTCRQDTGRYGRRNL
ncbi:hypothetical protein Vretifemale_20111 [Volvox reticuliferus]|uniref:Uncharacterized protein n=1 Tax=Volvox reticuliferus TaxID=1737510 RepID=A0A8J4D5X3_9CHLO|nr:hypothetical protein Vretifemale_20111 [Volvox reticuliferus]